MKSDIGEPILFTVDPGLDENLQNLLQLKRNRVDILKSFCEQMELTIHETTGIYRVTLDMRALMAMQEKNAIEKHGN